MQGHRPCILAAACFWLTFLFVGLMPLTAEAQVMPDTLDIRFAADSIHIDMNYQGNWERWLKFERSFQQKYSHLSPNSLRLDIYAGASPEGKAEYNRWLGENRGQAIRDLASQRLGSSIGEIVVHNEGARWDGLYKSVAASDEPWRDEALAIIGMEPKLDSNGRDLREARLRELRDSTVWPVLLARHLAPLRSGATVILSWQNGGGQRDTLVIQQTLVIRDTVYLAPSTTTTIIYQFHDSRWYADSIKAARRDSIHRSRLGYPAWAVKSNFLLWGVAAPNVQVEYPLGKGNRWSVEAEYFATWFTWSHNAHASQCQNLGVELRYWLGRRARHRWLQGWHIGAAVAGGYYDFEWKKHEGYQGEHLNTYLNIGYQHRWGKRWGLDFGVGVGALFTKYRHYFGSSVYPDNHLEEEDNHLIFHDKGNFTWIGPCHANISLVYFFNSKKRITPLETK